MSPAFALALPLLMTVLLACILGGLWRVLKGPTRADRMLAAQLFGTTATALLILMALAEGQPALLDVALVFAVLAAVTAVAFVVTSGRGAR
jgi:multicomponent Na+:H+ antiporter subunit F